MMPHLLDVLKLLIWPLVACVSMGLLHGYAGLHVLRRGVIFVDLALAQMAALGAVVGLALTTHTAVAPHSHRGDPAAFVAERGSQAPADELEQALNSARERIPERPAESTEEHTRGFLDFWPTVFALGGALLLAFGRVPGDRVPHEAIIGIVYVVAAAATVLILSKSPHGHEQMEEMLTGKLLFIDRDEVLSTGALYAGLGLLHVLFYRPFLAISTSAEAARHCGIRVRLWDCLFYAMFALMVTRSVAVGGVLVVFSFLIIPGACASMLIDDFKRRIWAAWLVATVVSVAGLTISAIWDLPTGSTVVATFGAALVLCIIGGAGLGRFGRSLQSRESP